MFVVKDSEDNELHVGDLVRAEGISCECTIAMMIDQDQVQVVPMKRGEPEILTGDQLTLTYHLGKVADLATNEELQNLLNGIDMKFEEIKSTKKRKAKAPKQETETLQL